MEHPLSQTDEEKSKSDFLSIDMHQLRNYITRNKWILDSLMEDKTDAILPVPKELLVEMNTNNEQTIHLISDLLRVQEEGTEVFKLFPIQVDLLEILRKIINNLKLSAAKKNVSFEYNDMQGRLPIIVDPEKIDYVFENLFANAIRYTPSGGSVSVHINKNQNEILISVKDTGIGIPILEQTNIFRKYFRATNARKVESQGTGLGLFIIKYIVEKHGGRIWFESEEGNGTTFWVTLPASK